MALKPDRTFLALPSGYRSREMASFIAQLDDQTKLLAEALDGIGVKELEWQPKPGMNTIGMLLAHLAIVEVWWFGGPSRLTTDVDFDGVLGIGGDDDGIPALPTGRHPVALRGKPLAFYLGLLKKSRAFVKREARKITDREMVKPLQQPRPDRGVVRHFDRRWIAYHVVEHFCGHHGQILMLRHWARVARRPR